MLGFRWITGARWKPFRGIEGPGEVLGQGTGALLWALCFVLLLHVPVKAQEGEEIGKQGFRESYVSKEVSFALTGDAIITRRLSPYEEPQYLRMIELIRDADVAYTNLEVLLHDYEGYPSATSGGTWMRAEPQMAEELVWAGFDVVSLANNHTMDYGVGGLRATIDALEEAGLVWAGAGMNLARARAPHYLETDGGRVALISVASTFSEGDEAGTQGRAVKGRPGLSPLRYRTTYTVSETSMAALRDVSEQANVRTWGEGDSLWFAGERFVKGESPGRHTRLREGDVEDILQAVRDARRQADWVVVASHTHESADSIDVPAEFLETFARKSVEAGADVVVSHGPHVLRGVEIYQGRPIFYSLGDFVFQNETVQYFPADIYQEYDLPVNTMPGKLQDRRIEASSSGGFPAYPKVWESVIAVTRFREGKLADIRLHPITLGHGRPRPRRGRPRLATPEHGRAIIEHLAELSKSYGTEVQYRPEENVGVIEGLK